MTSAPETLGSWSSARKIHSLKSKQTMTHNIRSLFGWWSHKRKTKKIKTYPIL